MNRPLRIVAIDDDPRILAIYRRALETAGIEVACFPEPAAGREHVLGASDEIDAVLLDVDMPEISGLELLVELRRAAPDLAVVMVTGDRSAETATAALKAGAFDYLLKPLPEPGTVVLAAQRAAEHGQLRRHARRLEQRLGSLEAFEQLVGGSPEMQRVFEMVERVAALDVGVLVLGESGTGKELVARAIHQRSPRAQREFVAINCAALPDQLIDSELFGHKRGAFTGAIESRPGAFTRAKGGTLFLDEIGDLPLPVQGRLLRVLQTGEYEVVGGAEPVKADVRILAATHVDLAEAVGENRFRDDLYYRLNVVRIAVPPLRERTGDIPLLAEHFVAKHAARLGRNVPVISPAALDELRARPWPGNVRELENAILAALALSHGSTTLERADLGGSHARSPGAPAQTEGPGLDPERLDLGWALDKPIREARDQLIEAFERAYLTHLLSACDGNQSEAARRAGLDRANLRRTLKRLGLL